MDSERLGTQARRVTPRFLAPPVDSFYRQMDEDDLPIPRILKAVNPTNPALFSGCRDNQTSADACLYWR
jgi:hypothetical protein